MFRVVFNFFFFLELQILNQPLAPATLILLNSLLQQIKNLQQLQQQATQQSIYPGGQPNKSGAYMTLTVKQQQCKQSIQALQVLYYLFWAPLPVFEFSEFFVW